MKLRPSPRKEAQVPDCLFMLEAARATIHMNSRHVLAVTVTVAMISLCVLAAARDAGAQQKPEFSFRFDDVEEHWAQDIIEVMYRSGVVSEADEGEFAPDKEVSRLDFTRWLVRAVGLLAEEDIPDMDFEDVDLIPDEARAEVGTAVENELIEGYPDGTFRPYKTVTRVQMATVLGRVLVRLGVRADRRLFTVFDKDGHLIPDWADPAAAAVKERLIVGRQPFYEFAPFEPTTRAEATVMLQRFMQTLSELDTEDLVQPPPTDVAPPDRYLVAGYYMGRDQYRGASYQSLQEAGSRVNMVIMATYSLDIGDDGEVKSSGYDSDFVFEQAAAHPNQEALVRFTNAGFCPDVASEILNDEQKRQRAVQLIESELREKPYSGVNINLEAVRPEDRDVLTEFVAEVWHEMGDDYLITMAVPAKLYDNPQHGWSGAFDYRALHPYLDYMIIMAYDQHWSTSRPGPVASLEWVRSVMSYTTAAVPRDKVLMGAPFYGYDWKDKEEANQARGITWPRAEQLLEEHELGEPDRLHYTPYFRYTAEDGTERIVYFEDEHILKARLKLLDEFGVAGVAFWRLGQENTRVWRSIIRPMLD